MMFWCNLNFQNFMQELNSNLEHLNDLVMLWMLVIMGIVMFFSYSLMLSKKSMLALESETMESFWTLAPMLILFSIILPSCSLLNKEDSFLSFTPDCTFKMMSFQWNWQSELYEEIFHGVDMDSFSYLNNLEEPLVSSNLLIRIILSSGDVLHSLGFPSLGIKLDSIPGRLNTSSLLLSCLGLISGSCYELCGSGHSMMPVSWLVL